MKLRAIDGRKDRDVGDIIIRERMIMPAHNALSVLVEQVVFVPEHDICVSPQEDNREKGNAILESRTRLPLLMDSSSSMLNV